MVTSFRYGRTWFGNSEREVHSLVQSIILSLALSLSLSLIPCLTFCRFWSFFLQGISVGCWHKLHTSVYSCCTDHVDVKIKSILCFDSTCFNEILRQCDLHHLQTNLLEDCLPVADRDKPSIVLWFSLWYCRKKKLYTPHNCVFLCFVCISNKKR